MNLLDRLAIPAIIAIIGIAIWQGCDWQYLGQQIGWTYVGRAEACSEDSPPLPVEVQEPLPSHSNENGQGQARAGSPGGCPQDASAHRAGNSSLGPALPNYGRDGQPNDRRNWMVAEYKGDKYGVSPALLIAIRSHENPKRSRDRYALGVKAFKYTNIWVQYEWGARIVARIAQAQGWCPLEPTPSRLYRLGVVYVGQGEIAAKHWSRCVWSLYKKALSQTGQKPNLK